MAKEQPKPLDLPLDDAVPDLLDPGQFDKGNPNETGGTKRSVDRSNQDYYSKRLVWMVGGLSALALMMISVAAGYWASSAVANRYKHQIHELETLLQKSHESADEANKMHSQFNAMKQDLEAAEALLKKHGLSRFVKDEAPILAGNDKEAARYNPKAFDKKHGGNSSAEEPADTASHSETASSPATPAASAKKSAGAPLKPECTLGSQQSAKELAACLNLKQNVEQMNALHAEKSGANKPLPPKPAAHPPSSGH